jgi:hypothetical protein
MTRKDYELIAKVLRESDGIIDQMALEALAENLAEALEQTNPRFDARKFIFASTWTETKKRETLATIDA